MPVKYILVTGGVISGIGKGIIASSTGLLLKAYGLRVTAIKIDPYLNIDAGTLSPLDHGEVFVLNDGGEVDLDLGNYERFLDVTLTRDNNITTGKIYRNVIEKERRGDYLGKTVQVVPHITDAVQDWVMDVATRPVDDTGKEPQVCIIELGGTVGDIESAPYVEALRQFQFKVGHENFALIHVSLVPLVGSVGEQKSKPTQNSVRDLRALGLSPDVVACRSEQPLQEGIREKISMFCHVAPEQVLAVHDCPSTYHVPLLLHGQGLIEVLEKRLNLGKMLSPSASPMIRSPKMEGAAGTSNTLHPNGEPSISRPSSDTSICSSMAETESNASVPNGVTPQRELSIPHAGSRSGAPSAQSHRHRHHSSRRKKKRRELSGDTVLWRDWQSLAHTYQRSHEVVTIGLVGKYTDLHDSYCSVTKALEHAAIRAGKRLEIAWIEASDLEPVVPLQRRHSVTDGTDPTTIRRNSVESIDSVGSASDHHDSYIEAKEDRQRKTRAHHDAWKKLASADGILVPGGFGLRGVEGMVAAAKYARENNVPYLGICLGMQVGVMEFARNVVGMKGACSEEFDGAAARNVTSAQAQAPASAPQTAANGQVPTKHGQVEDVTEKFKEMGMDPERPYVVVYMPEISKTHMGGTMRLGNRSTTFDAKKQSWSIAYQLYGRKSLIYERHRHRYEVNPTVVTKLEASGLHFTGTSDKRMEIMELPGHPFYVGAQYHPELTSRPLKPNPMFLGLVLASSGFGVLEEFLETGRIERAEEGM